MEPVSPELILVASPEEAAAARASLALPRLPAPRGSSQPLGRGTLATLYTTCLVMTATPVALLALLSHPPH